eukprot:Awhi_evm1s8889
MTTMIDRDQHRSRALLLGSEVFFNPELSWAFEYRNFFDFDPDIRAALQWKKAVHNNWKAIEWMHEHPTEVGKLGSYFCLKNLHFCEILENDDEKEEFSTEENKAIRFEKMKWLYERGYITKFKCSSYDCTYNCADKNLDQHTHDWNNNLDVAACYGNIDAFSYLLENSREKYTLQCTSHDSFEFIKMAYEKNALNFDSDGENLFIAIVQFGELDFLKKLYDEGIFQGNEITPY